MHYRRKMQNVKLAADGFDDPAVVMPDRDYVYPGKRIEVAVRVGSVFVRCRASLESLTSSGRKNDVSTRSRVPFLFVMDRFHTATCSDALHVTHSSLS